MAIVDYFLFDESLTSIFLVISLLISLFFFMNGADMFVKFNINSPRLAVIREQTLLHMLPSGILLGLAWFSSLSGIGLSALHWITLSVFIIALLWRYYGFTGIFVPVNDPFFISAEEAEEQISDYLTDDLIIGVDLNGEQRAYPIKPLQITHAVNDQIGDTAISVTFCGLCNLGIVFDRTIDSEARNLRAVYAGKSNLVLTDDEGNYWQQLTGQGLLGKYAKGNPLKQFDIAVTTWKSWKQQYPKTKVLGNKLVGKAKFGFKWFKRLLHLVRKTDFVLFPAGAKDDRLGPKDKLLGVILNDKQLAIPINLYSDIIQVNEILDEKPIFVYFDTSSERYGAFLRKEDENYHILKREENIVIQSSSGAEWDGEGKSITASDDLVKTKKMYPAFWFAWIGHYPDTILVTP